MIYRSSIDTTPMKVILKPSVVLTDQLSKHNPHFVVTDEIYEEEFTNIQSNLSTPAEQHSSFQVRANSSYSKSNRRRNIHNIRKMRLK